MRRKVFAVLMIVALILCFMPSTAFAWYGGNVEIPPADFGGESGGESGEESGGEVIPPGDNGVGAASMMMLLSAAGAMALLLLGRKKEKK